MLSIMISFVANKRLRIKKCFYCGSPKVKKNGVRNGTTRYKDANDKTIKKESYKDGILKE